MRQWHRGGATASAPHQIEISVFYVALRCDEPQPASPAARIGSRSQPTLNYNGHRSRVLSRKSPRPPATCGRHRRLPGQPELTLLAGLQAGRPGTLSGRPAHRFLSVNDVCSWMHCEEWIP
eukprot:scaffold321540_cov30-Tisochrysis_lutea.AAC.2